jgi:hypothetical protein
VDTGKSSAYGVKGSPDGSFSTSASQSLEHSMGADEGTVLVDWHRWQKDDISNQSGSSKHRFTMFWERVKTLSDFPILITVWASKTLYTWLLKS